MIEPTSPRVYFDTNIFVEAFEGRTDRSKGLLAIFTGLRSRPGCAVTSELTLAELFGKVSAKGWDWQRRFYLDLIVWGDLFDLRPVTRALLIETGNLRKAAKENGRALGLPDAIHIVTALRAGCRDFLSYDRGLFLPSPLLAIRPEPKDIDWVIRRLDV